MATLRVASLWARCPNERQGAVGCSAWLSVRGNLLMPLSADKRSQHAPQGHAGCHGRDTRAGATQLPSLSVLNSHAQARSHMYNRTHDTCVATWDTADDCRAARWRCRR